MSKKSAKSSAAPKQAATEKPKAAPKQSLIYLGPTIPGVVRHANVFSNGLPSVLENAVSEYPVMRRMIVPISEAPALTKELNKEESAAKNVYAAIVKKYKL